MNKIDNTTDLFPVKKRLEAVDPYSLLCRFEKGITCHFRMPQVNIILRDDEFDVRAELPGVNIKNIEISMTENSVTIQESIKQSDTEEFGSYYRREIPVDIYARALKLPTRVNAENSIAIFKDALLKLKMPKVKYTKPGDILIS